MKYLIIQYSNKRWEIFKKIDDQTLQRCKAYYDSIQDLTSDMNNENFFITDNFHDFNSLLYVIDNYQDTILMEIVTPKQLNLLTI